MSDPIRLLTDHGCQTFLAYIRQLKDAPATQPPFRLLVDDATSTPAPFSAVIEQNPDGRWFPTRYDFGTYLASALSECPLVAILRGIAPAECEAVGAALIDSGFRIIEVPLNSPDPLDSIRILGDHFGERALIGAGTVLSPAVVDQVADAGGRLIVMPHSDPSVIVAAKARGLACLPGVATPTDVELAMSLGVSTLKFFPAEQLGGTATLKALAGPYPDVQFVPTGGITPELLPQYLRLPSVVACGGSWLAPRDMLTQGKFDAIRLLAQQAVKILAGPPPAS